MRVVLSLNVRACSTRPRAAQLKWCRFSWHPSDTPVFRGHGGRGGEENCDVMLALCSVCVGRGVDGPSPNGGPRPEALAAVQGHSGTATNDDDFVKHDNVIIATGIKQHIFLNNAKINIKHARAGSRRPVLR